MIGGAVDQPLRLKDPTRRTGYTGTPGVFSRLTIAEPLETQIMKYILLAYRDEQQWEAMQASDQAGFEAACRASEQDLTHSLHLIDAWDVEGSTALTVRLVDGSVSLIEGPAAGNQKQLIQLLFVQARDLNAAIQIASKLPQARGGPIEVRPLLEGKS